MDDEDIVWQEDDPDFLAALSVYMDEVEANASAGHVNQKPASRLVDDETWNEEDPDFAIALSMYLDEVESGNKTSSSLSGSDRAEFITSHGCVVDHELEQLDPNPDIWKLFRLFDDRFFDGQLKKNGVMIGWSPKMTSCAGLCSWNTRASFCEIKLSQPLLLLRPRSDLVETLIHEMIHALLFVTRQDDNHESHGQLFHAHMYRINKSAGCKISVFHNFHDEVRFYQRHVWKCDGPCSRRPPYFGIVRRAMNRPPGPSDFWFAGHQSTCGGKFVKIQSPEPADKVKKVADAKAAGIKTPTKRRPKGTPDIRNFFEKTPEKQKPVQTGTQSTSSQGSGGTSEPSATRPPIPRPPDFDGDTNSFSISAFEAHDLKLPDNFVPFSGAGHVLGSAPRPDRPVLRNVFNASKSMKQERSATATRPAPKKEMIEVIDLE